MKTPQEWLEISRKRGAQTQPAGLLRFIAQIQDDAVKDAGPACAEKHAALVRMTGMLEDLVPTSGAGPIQRPAWLKKALAASCGRKEAA